MTAAEIRKLRDESIVAYKIDGSLDERNQLMFFLSEVAAQLAELNDAGKPSKTVAKIAIHYENLRTAVEQLLYRLDQVATDELVRSEPQWSREYAEEFKAVKDLLS
jgi:hypothetical protein